MCTIVIECTIVVIFPLFPIKKLRLTSSALRGHSFFFIPATIADDLRPPSKILSITFFVLSLFLSISLLMLTAKQGTYWYHLYNVFGIARSLTMYWTRDLPHWMSSLYTRLSRRIVIFVRNEIVFVFKPESYMQSFYSTE